MHTFTLRSISIVLTSCLLLSGCYSLRVTTNQPQAATDPQSSTEWFFLWGLVQPQVNATRCVSGAVYEVKTSTNLGYALITVATLGIVCPINAEYTCAKPCVPEVPPQ
jgi:hypothetical protein